MIIKLKIYLNRIALWETGTGTPPSSDMLLIFATRSRPTGCYLYSILFLTYISSSVLIEKSDYIQGINFQISFFAFRNYSPFTSCHAAA